MNIIRIYPMLVLLCLFFAAQQMNAQCDMTLSAVVTHIPCFGGEGTIDLTVENGTAPYEFAWSDGQTDEDAIVLSAGLYIVTVTDALGCVKNLARTITGPTAALSLVLNDGGIISCQNPESNITTTVGGGIAPYNYLWSTGATTNVLAADSVGVYTVTVTDANSCTITDSRTVLVDPSYPVADAGPFEVPISCATAPNIIGGPGTSMGPDFVYQWRNFVAGFDPGVDPTQPFIEVTEFGFYELEVTNIVEGCTAYDLVYVTPDNSFPVITTQVPPPLSCLVTQVSLNATGSSAGPEYSYLWTTSNGHIVSGETTLTPVVDAPGAYILTIANNQVGCTKKGLVTVVEGQGNFIANAGPDTGIPCGGNQVTLDGSGSSSGVQYTHTWTTLDGNILAGANTLNPIVNQPGTYTLLVVDTQNGCTKTDEVRVFPGPVIPQADFLILDVSCTGQLGSADVTMSQGTPPYSYLWSNGSTDLNANNIFQGTHTVTVTDATGCNYYGEVEIGDTSTITLSALTTTPSCNPGNDGAIDLTAISFALPFEYAWSTGETTQDLSNLNAGTYTVTVTYAGATCTQTLSVTLSDSSGLTLSTVVTDAPCSGACTGSINLTVTGGVAPYDYAWSPGNNTQDISNLCPNTYTVTVTDANGCIKTVSATVGQTSGLTLSAVVTASTSCTFSNGTIDLTVAPTGSYTYTWSVGQTTQDLSNILAGTYTVTVSDGVICTAVDTYIVPDLPNLPIPSAISTPTTCDFSNGSINASVTGGVAPYNYQWSTGATTQDLSNISWGLYWLTVTGANGCTNIISVDIVNNNQSVTVNGTITPNTVCVGNPNGSIDVTVTPLAAYTYLWSNSTIVEDLNNLPAGTYALTVSAGGTCTQTASFDVPDNSNAPIITPTVTDATCNGSDGAIDLTITGGVSPYTVDWFNIPGANNPEDLFNLSAGTYTCTVTDFTGCSQVAIVMVGQLSDLAVSVVKNDVSCFAVGDGAIDLTVTGTATPFSYLWSFGGATTQDLIGLGAGTYRVTVTDTNGCTKTISATLTAPMAISCTYVVTSILCNGDSNGAIDITSVSGGTMPYSYEWFNGATTSGVNNLSAGMYLGVITDANGCAFSLFVTLADPPPFTFTIVSLSNDCSTETITGPNLPNLFYAWSGPNGFTSNAAAISTGFSGLYSLTITNANGCTASNNYTVNLSGGGACGAITGRVFHDENESCTLNTGEPGLAGWIVRAEGLNDTLYGVTNDQGQYLLGVPVGTYAMKVFVPNGLWTICPGGSMATVGMAGDTVSGGDFPVQSTFICPALTVSIGTNQLRRCFSNNFYQVEYCNQGTEAAQDAFITVALDPFLTTISASIPYIVQGANVLRFEVGDLDIGECGAFSIQVHVNCNAVFGQTHCTQATISPDTLCVPTSSNWSGASLDISSLCDTDSLRFAIQNTGSGGMNGSSGYIVVEDGIMFRSGTLDPLAPGSSMIISVPANGSTWRVEVGQELFHPYAAPVGLSVEGCVTTSSFSTGFVNQFPYNDEPPTVDVDCTTNIGSFDPNDKHGYPVGYGADHYIRPGTDIEYLVRFQNTGTDTAFTVRIVDTLSAWLDPATIRFGASSHPYRYDLNGEGIVHFIFESIHLPDSNTNEVASHGFAKFQIKPRLDAPLESRIENTAAIYFDFNDPVFTNTTFHRLGNNFITVGLWQPEMPAARIIAMPNPFNEQTMLEVKGLVRSTGLRLQVFDLLGNVVREMESEDAVFQLRKGDCPSGIYLFKITQNGRLVGSGKLMTE